MTKTYFQLENICNVSSFVLIIVLRKYLKVAHAVQMNFGFGKNFFLGETLSENLQIYQEWSKSSTSISTFENSLPKHPHALERDIMCWPTALYTATATASITPKLCNIPLSPFQIDLPESVGDCSKYLADLCDPTDDLSTSVDPTGLTLHFAVSVPKYLERLFPSYLLSLKKSSSSQQKYREKAQAV